MDFDKLRKAALETLKIMGGKSDEKAEETEPAPDEEPAVEEEQEVAADDRFGETQRLDLKSMLDKFRKKKAAETPEHAPEEQTEDDAAEKSEPETSGIEREIAPAPTRESYPEPRQEIAPAPAAVIDCSLFDDLKDTLSEMDKEISEISRMHNEQSAEVAQTLEELTNGLNDLRRASEKSGEANSSIIARLNNTEKKLNSMSNTLAGVSKLNDSIFDLKNSQMNTKNSLGDLEASFFRLKRKMSTSVLIISILTAIIAVLEIINLLS